MRASRYCQSVRLLASPIGVKGRSTHMSKNPVTSPKVARIAAKVLGKASTPKPIRSIAGAALVGAKPKPKR